MSIIAIKLYYSTSILIIAIISLIYFKVYYINYNISNLLYRLYLLKPIISVLNHLFYFKLLYVLCLSLSIKPTL